MAIIQKKVQLEGSVGSVDEVALFDSGATYSCIQPSLARQLGMVERLPKPMVLNAARNGDRLEAKEVVRLDFYLEGYRFSDEFIPDGSGQNHAWFLGH